MSEERFGPWPWRNAEDIEGAQQVANINAAAHEMYEALAKIVAHDEYMVEMGILRHFGELDLANAALKKARGES